MSHYHAAISLTSTIVLLLPCLIQPASFSHSTHSIHIMPVKSSSSSTCRLSKTKKHQKQKPSAPRRDRARSSSPARRSSLPARSILHLLDARAYPSTTMLGVPQTLRKMMMMVIPPLGTVNPNISKPSFNELLALAEVLSLLCTRKVV